METHHITPARGLSETGLKWIALVTMVLDHIHYFFSFTGCVPEWFSMVGRLGAPLFLFCLVEGFTHTHSRKRYFARVYVLSTAMSLLFFFMAFAHVLVRPDGFYPANGMMTTFVILMVMFQGIDWLGRRHIVRGLAALLLPLAWPFLASALSLAVPALATPVGLAAYSVLPAWGTTGDSSWPVLAMGLVLYLFRRNRRGQVLAFAVFYSFTGWCIWASWPPRCPISPGASSSPGTTRSTVSWPHLSCCAIMGSGAEATSGCSTPSIPPISTSSTPCRGGSIFC